MPNEQLSYVAYVERFVAPSRTETKTNELVENATIKIYKEPTTFQRFRGSATEMLYEGSISNIFFTLECFSPYKVFVPPLGWKFHISIDDGDIDPNTRFSQNLANGWEIVKNILIKHQISFSKVVMPNEQFSTDPNKAQYGKQISIYPTLDTRKNNIQFWRSVLGEIEHELDAANIKPDRNNIKRKDIPIRGNTERHYISCRNDLGIKAEDIGYIACIRHFNALSDTEKSKYSSLDEITYDLSSAFLFYFSTNEHDSPWNQPIASLPTLFAQDPSVSIETLILLLNRGSQITLEQLKKLPELLPLLCTIYAQEQELYQQREIIAKTKRREGYSEEEIAKELYHDETLTELRRRLNATYAQRITTLQKILMLSPLETDFFSSLENVLQLQLKQYSHIQQIDLLEIISPELIISLLKDEIEVDNDKFWQDSVCIINKIQALLHLQPETIPLSEERANDIIIYLKEFSLNSNLKYNLEKFCVDNDVIENFCYSKYAVNDNQQLNPYADMQLIRPEEQEEKTESSFCCYRKQTISQPQRSAQESFRASQETLIIEETFNPLHNNSRK